jgi:hypothetical protein
MNGKDTDAAFGCVEEVRVIGTVRIIFTRGKAPGGGVPHDGSPLAPGLGTECFFLERRSLMPSPADYFSFAYSALASFRMGMSESASFQRAKKSW